MTERAEPFFETNMFYCVLTVLAVFSLHVLLHL
jgi:hypothetical protein